MARIKGPKPIKFNSRKFRSCVKKVKKKEGLTAKSARAICIVSLGGRRRS